MITSWPTPSAGRACWNNLEGKLGTHRARPGNRRRARGVSPETHSNATNQQAGKLHTECPAESEVALPNRSKTPHGQAAPITNPCIICMITSFMFSMCVSANGSSQLTNAINMNSLAEMNSFCGSCHLGEPRRRAQGGNCNRGRNLRPSPEAGRSAGGTKGRRAATIRTPYPHLIVVRVPDGYAQAAQIPNFPKLPIHHKPPQTQEHHIPQKHSPKEIIVPKIIVPM